MSDEQLRATIDVLRKQIDHDTEATRIYAETFKRLQAENAALREVVAAVVAADEPCTCTVRGSDISHADACPVRMAQYALLDRTRSSEHP